MFYRAKAPTAKKNVGLWGREWVDGIGTQDHLCRSGCRVPQISTHGVNFKVEFREPNQNFVFIIPF